MIIKEYFYNIQCDCCGISIGNEELWHVDEEGAKEDAYDYGEFKHLGGKDYCPNCWELDDNDNIKTKDGKVFDGETEKEIVL